MRTWVLKIKEENVNFDVLLYGDDQPTKEDVVEVLRRRGLPEGAETVIVVEKAYDFGQGRLRATTYGVDYEEEHRQKVKLQQLWREAEEENRAEREARYGYKKRREVQDRVNEVSVGARDSQGGEGRAGEGREEPAAGRAGGSDRGPGDELIISIIKGVSR